MIGSGLSRARGPPETPPRTGPAYETSLRIPLPIRRVTSPTGAKEGMRGKTAMVLPSRPSAGVTRATTGPLHGNPASTASSSTGPQGKTASGAEASRLVCLPSEGFECEERQVEAAQAGSANKGEELITLSDDERPDKQSSTRGEEAAAKPARSVGGAETDAAIALVNSLVQECERVRATAPTEDTLARLIRQQDDNTEALRLLHQDLRKLMESTEMESAVPIAEVAPLEQRAAAACEPPAAPEGLVLHASAQPNQKAIASSVYVTPQREAAAAASPSLPRVAVTPIWSSDSPRSAIIVPAPDADISSDSDADGQESDHEAPQDKEPGVTETESPPSPTFRDQHYESHPPSPFGLMCPTAEAAT
ncbi:unnamed protein product [Vitrella brassicaformis CCMP3155]|uniref:Uncharacterized protein n=1 Tax=Vitrella brassicaformis (strain CCMP3155) TaxID=1169540 RepID=A0A0G4FT46_VITBC|nr:unnamed protein product [Vitrella brassicaformis CCMP3155]|eukprot:CEM17858.1 unnamed protein product [Vitrella brassicaformis CCMP3155]